MYENNLAKEFDKANGRCIRIDGWFYFANGAKREIHPLGLLLDPPQDQFERLKIARVFRHTMYTRAVSAFANRKAELLEEAQIARKHGALPPELDAARDELEELGRKVKVAKQKLDRLDKDIAATPQGRQQAMRETALAESRARSAAACEQFLGEIKTISV